MSATKYGQWPPQIEPDGILFLDGNGTVLYQRGNVVGAVTKPGAGEIRIALNVTGTADYTNTMAMVTPSDPAAHIGQFVITDALYVRTYDSAGVIDNVTNVFVAIYTTLPVPSP